MIAKFEYFLGPKIWCTGVCYPWIEPWVELQQKSWKWKYLVKIGKILTRKTFLTKMRCFQNHILPFNLSWIQVTGMKFRESGFSLVGGWGGNPPIPPTDQNFLNSHPPTKSQFPPPTKSHFSHTKFWFPLFFW